MHHFDETDSQWFCLFIFIGQNKCTENLSNKSSIAALALRDNVRSSLAVKPLFCNQDEFLREDFPLLVSEIVHIWISPDN